MTSPSPSAPRFQRIAVLGGGAWGTALAQTAARAGRDVSLWAREAEVVRSISETGENPDFLPGVALDRAIRAHGEMAEVLEGAEAVLAVCPAQAMRPVLSQARRVWPGPAPLVLCAKGLEVRTGLRLSEIAASLMPEVPLAVLSGPTFAREVAEGRPTAVTLAAADPALAESLVAALGTRTFRPYAAADIVGVEIGGAVKNVLAIACGVVEGRGLGDNARAALLTRGLAEIIRLGRALGAHPETLSGLSGLGDLILTATSLQSRNFSLGVALGEGRTLSEILAARRTVAEGVHTAAAIESLAERLGVEMPICEAVNHLLRGTHTVEEAVETLLSRPLKSERD